MKKNEYNRDRWLKGQSANHVYGRFEILFLSCLSLNLLDWHVFDQIAHTVDLVIFARLIFANFTEEDKFANSRTSRKLSL